MPINKNALMKNSIEQPRIIHLSETDSTNAALKSISENEELPSGSIVYADVQTAGRGQRGSSWESEAGKNLTFSILFRPLDVPANMPFVISEMTSLCVKYTLDNYIPEISVKWPNDIYHKDKKISGILIENTILQGKISESIIGIGININQIEFRSNAPNPISMAQITGFSFENMTILKTFRKIFMEQSARINNKLFESIHKEYLNSVYHKVGYHTFRDSKGIFEAKIQDIEPTGNIVLKRKDGTCSKYTFKEVSFLYE